MLKFKNCRPWVIVEKYISLYNAQISQISTPQEKWVFFEWVGKSEFFVKGKCSYVILCLGEPFSMCMPWFWCMENNIFTLLSSEYIGQGDVTY